jgi:ABC-type Fe3+/spermidine/putrescine transport system ATPase subunit
VLREIGFSVDEGEFVALLGPNGSGKTTLLRCLTGLDTPSAGSIYLRGRRIEGEPTHRRGIGLVSQEPSLFPHRTVRENIAYGPLIQHVPRAETIRRVEELLDRLELTRFADRYPTQLSGGEQQRVALARALAPEPALVLLDEPFASVDPQLRAELRGEFRHILGSRHVAAIHVTHDREEGMFLGERALILMEGRLVQAGPPREVLARPASAAVARFLGYNILPGPSGWVAVSPERVRCGRPGERGRSATVLACGPVGEGWSVHLRLADGRRAEALRPAAEGPLPVGASVGLEWDGGIGLPDGPPASPTSP